MRSLRQQRGMTAIGWLLVLGLIAFFVLITLRLVPLYLEYAKVTSVLESIENEPGITTKSRAEIISLIQRRLDVNDVRELDPRKKFYIRKEKGYLIIGTRYERREPMLGNVDVVASFDKEVKVPIR
ncbi:MAG TPA: DUF4845 domain-containing protein [Gammaproteobacteria bacterium]|nr:DUF4845 domain-containing protein [Gammaproteobacteria bacterium]